MEFHQQLQKHFEDIGLSQVAIAERLGVTKAYVNALLSGRQSFGKKQAQIWSEQFGLSRSWLLTGEGKMLKPDGLEKESQEEQDEASDMEVSKGFIVPLVPMAAMGGELVGFEEDGVRDEDCEKVISPVSGASFAVPIYGDSMEPEYPNGSRVFVKQINPSDFIAWGNAYVLDTTNGIILKIVVKSEDPDSLCCISLNPSGRYQPFDVPKRTIRGMYRVLACVIAKG